jgi:hypothetical protein
MEEDLIIELWDVFKEYIPDKNKEIAANHFVDFLLGKDVSQSVLEGLLSYDPHLDDAINLVIENEEEEADNADDEWDTYSDED